MNIPRKHVLAFLTTQEELKEVSYALEGLGLLMAKEQASKAKQVVLLKRTFNQNDFQGGYIRFWRVIGPATHPSLNSDISVLKLKEWGLIK